MPTTCTDCGGDGVEVASCAESRRCQRCQGTGQVVVTGENIGKNPVRVRHTELQRVNETSPFRSWCPVCRQGILLVGRTGLVLNRVDRCTMCGQLIIYEDDEIAGEPLEQTLVFGSATSEGYTQGCKLCGKGLAYPEAAFCGAACCARWEAGERPKWPSRWERLMQ